MSVSLLLKGAAVAGVALSVGYCASSLAELSSEGRWWHKRLGPEDEEDDFDEDFDQDEDEFDEEPWEEA